VEILFVEQSGTKRLERIAGGNFQRSTTVRFQIKIKTAQSKQNIQTLNTIYQSASV